MRINSFILSNLGITRTIFVCFLLTTKVHAQEFDGVRIAGPVQEAIDQFSRKNYSIRSSDSTYHLLTTFKENLPITLILYSTPLHQLLWKASISYQGYFKNRKKKLIDYRNFIWQAEKTLGPCTERKRRYCFWDREDAFYFIRRYRYSIETSITNQNGLCQLQEEFCMMQNKKKE